MQVEMEIDGFSEKSSSSTTNPGRIELRKYSGRQLGVGGKYGNLPRSRSRLGEMER